MVEGPAVHRIAAAHRSVLLGKSFTAYSPNGRLGVESRTLTGKTLSRIEAHGKNLFYFFGGLAVLHIHFGMSGQFSLWDSARAPVVRDTTRLVLDDGSICAHLSAMTTTLGGLNMYKDKVKLLGEDPLREDASVNVIWEKVRKSNKTIGQLLMDQSVFAGIGNIYRAEILFKARVHPNSIGKSLSLDAFRRIWNESVMLMQKGFVEGRMMTVDYDDLGVCGDRSLYVYAQKRCCKCRGPVSQWEAATRTVYCCENCQVLSVTDGASISTNEDIIEDKKSADFRVSELKAALIAKGLPSNGLKAVLIDRLQASQGIDNTIDHSLDFAKPGLPFVEMRSANAAERGQSSLEHVALVDRREGMSGVDSMSITSSDKTKNSIIITSAPKSELLKPLKRKYSRENRVKDDPED